MSPPSLWPRLLSPPGYIWFCLPIRIHFRVISNTPRPLPTGAMSYVRLPCFPGRRMLHQPSEASTVPSLPPLRREAQMAAPSGPSEAASGCCPAATTSKGIKSGKKRRKAICDDEDGAPMHGTPDTSARASHPFMHAEGDGASDVPHPPAQMLPKPVRKRTVVLSVKDWCEWHDRICGATACSDAGHTLRDEVARA